MTKLNAIRGLLWVLQAFFRGKVLRQKSYRPDGSHFRLPAPLHVKHITMLMKWWGYQAMFLGEQEDDRLPKGTSIPLNSGAWVDRGYLDADGIYAEQNDPADRFAGIAVRKGEKTTFSFGHSNRSRHAIDVSRAVAQERSASMRKTSLLLTVMTALVITTTFTALAEAADDSLAGAEGPVFQIPTSHPRDGCVDGVGPFDFEDGIPTCYSQGVVEGTGSTTTWEAVQEDPGCTEPPDCNDIVREIERDTFNESWFEGPLTDKRFVAFELTWLLQSPFDCGSIWVCNDEHLCSYYPHPLYGPYCQGMGLLVYGLQTFSGDSGGRQKFIVDMAYAPTPRSFLLMLGTDSFGAVMGGHFGTDNHYYFDAPEIPAIQVYAYNSTVHVYFEWPPQPPNLETRVDIEIDEGCTGSFSRVESPTDRSRNVFIDNDLVNGTCYRYRAKNVLIYGSEVYSDPSAVWEVYPLDGIPAPIPDLRMNKEGEDDMRASWGSLPGATSYGIRVSTDPADVRTRDPDWFQMEGEPGANEFLVETISELPTLYYDVDAYDTEGDHGLDPHETF